MDFKIFSAKLVEFNLIKKYSGNRIMKLKYKINLPQKSIFGFKILSSFHSSICCYILIFFGKILNTYFGYSFTQVIAAGLFNIILNISLMILIFNLYVKRNQLNRNLFVFLNLILFLYSPITVYEIAKNIKLMLNFLFF